jgi:ATP sulfurylase
VPFRDLVYLPEEERYEEVSKIAEHTATISLSGTRVREEYLNKGKPLPSWFTRPQVAEIPLGDPSADSPTGCVRVVHRIEWRGEINHR